MAYRMGAIDPRGWLSGASRERAMVRLSDSPIVNVASGGGETGFFVIVDKA
jgi:hypothetical protein